MSLMKWADTKRQTPKKKTTNKWRWNIGNFNLSPPKIRKHTTNQKNSFFSFYFEMKLIETIENMGNRNICQSFCVQVKLISLIRRPSSTFIYNINFTDIVWQSHLYSFCVDVVRGHSTHIPTCIYTDTIPDISIDVDLFLHRVCVCVCQAQ